MESPTVPSSLRYVLGIGVIVFTALQIVFYYLDLQALGLKQSVAQVASITPRATLSPSPRSTVLAESGEARASTSKIKLRTATQAELESLPGIGPAKARDILQYRETYGFRSFNDLDKVKGIGTKTLEQLRPLVEL